MPIGAWRRISRIQVSDRSWAANARFRDLDGRTRQVQARGPTGAAAERKLFILLESRATPSADELGPASTIATLAARWLADLDAGTLAINTKSGYRWVAEDYVVRGLGAVRIDEMTVGRVEAFLRSIDPRHGQASARLARSVLSGMFALAARHDAAPEKRREGLCSRPCGQQGSTCTDRGRSSRSASEPAGGSAGSPSRSSGPCRCSPPEPG